jgi:hypothetical protein
MGHRRVSPLGVIARYRPLSPVIAATVRILTLLRRVARKSARWADQDRRTQRKPMWLMPVSTICGRRAAGR